MADGFSTRAREFGVFLPIANGGWIISETTPPLDGLWRQNLDAAVLADRLGLDFVMSMGKWRGFGGVTDHWGTSMESVTMMAAIAQATTRVKIWATMHALLHNPAVAAKMITTLDHISGGRAGLNIVAGAYRGEFEQMGAWDDSLTHDDRYELAQEWAAIVKRLWTPYPALISAGMSERGFQFAVREVDACFIGGQTSKERCQASRRAKAVAADHHSSIKTYAMCTVIHAETDAKAETLVERYKAGVDMAAVREMLINWGTPPDHLGEIAEAQGPFMTQTAVGSPQTCAEQIESFVTLGELDGLMLIFPDYIEGLTMFGRDILPGLRKTFA